MRFIELIFWKIDVVDPDRLKNGWDLQKADYIGLVLL